MIKFFRYIVSFFFLALFAGVIFSISNVNFSKLPPPTNATSTGFLTWHSKIKNLDQETWYSMILFTSILQIISGVFMLIWSFKYEPLNVFILNGVKTSTTLFNKLLAGYVITTSISTIAITFLDLGKFYTTIGALHSYFEVLILIILHQGGRIVSHNILTLSIIYLLISEGTTILLHWPYDAIWFKFQGLAVDWALSFQFVRLYLTTKKISRDGYTNLPQHTSDERESEEYDQLNHEHHCHNYVFYLAFAAFRHILGNVIGAFFLIEGLGANLFVFSYAFLSNTLAFAVYFDTHKRPNKHKTLNFIPYSSVSCVVLITIVSMTFSLLCARIGLFYVERHG
ncbi:patatin-domain-containing protein [Gigaspora margarita]|uniref:Patatin-domain-containing protein n=1 Tax=Gigaspora margarita TaxID=4874 RepID=A0A8H4ELP1_GIGMA|nr:patatin-domain-containing protein [Gigaspora margarita]